MGDAVDAHKLGRDALPHLGVVVRLPQDGQPGVGVQVNEAGADDISVGVDGPRRRQPRNVTAVNADTVALNRHGGKEPRAPGTVYDKTVGDEQIDHKCLAGVRCLAVIISWPRESGRGELGLIMPRQSDTLHREVSHIVGDQG